MTTKTTYQVTIECRCEICGKEGRRVSEVQTLAQLHAVPNPDGFTSPCIMDKFVTLCASCRTHAKIVVGGWELKLSTTKPEAS